MNGHVHKPRPSAYVRAYRALLEASRDLGRPLGRDEAFRRMKVTPGVAFADGVTLDDVLDTLEVWRLIRRRDGGIEVLGA